MTASATRDSFGVLLKPIVTEKSQVATDELGQVAFKVRRDANKIEIKQAVEEVFGVGVVRVNTTVAHGKVKRRGRRIGRLPNWKKAVVTLAEGATIDLFEGV